MSHSDERTTLDRPISLYRYAARLRRQFGDQPIPYAVRRQPGTAGTTSSRTSFSDGVTDLASVLREFIDDPGQSARDLHDRCCALDIHFAAVPDAIRAVAVEPSPQVVDAARWLVRHGTDCRAVLVGLGLLAGTATGTDVALVTTIGLLRFADKPAVTVLATLPGASSALMWLAERSRPHARIAAVHALAGNTDSRVRDWILGTPRTLLTADLARRIAEARDIAELLEQAAVTDDVWKAVGNLLLAMTGAGNYRYEIDRYEPAASVYARWCHHLGALTPTIDRAALVTMVCADIATGPAALVVGERGRDLVEEMRGKLMSGAWRELLDRCAVSPDPVEARRAAWVIDSVARIPTASAGFRIHVAVPDPVPDGYPMIETRIVVDGVPLIAAAFDKGPPEQPENLVAAARLIATETPREVRLAEAYCTEGCCGALYVTIARDGTDVVWSNWRGYTRGAEPAELRLNAAEYDAEVARAEQDHSWESPARTVARLLRADLQADPGLLGRWGCRLHWCSTWPGDVDITRLMFGFPEVASADEPYVQFGLVINVNTATPEAVVAEVVDRIRTTDPKNYAEVVGGTSDGVARLGLSHREPTRWEANRLNH